MRHLLIIFLLTCAFSEAFSQADSLRPAIDTGYFSSFDGTKIYYEKCGKGKPVLLVHGFIVTGASWKNTQLYKDLVESGYCIITPDMRGNGKSGKPHDSAAYEHDAEAKDLMGLLDALGVAHYDVVGYSRGSIIVSRLLLLDKRIDKAVMGGMGTGFTDSLWPRRVMFFNALSGKNVPALASLVKYVDETPSLDKQALALLQRFQPFTSPAALLRISKPVLLVCGDKDEDNGSGKALADMIPNAGFESVPGDHNHASQTKEFSAAVRKFLQ